MKNILVVGAGAMGSGIAYVLATKLRTTQIHILELSQQQREKSQANYEKWLKKDLAVAGEDFNRQQLEASVKNIHFYASENEVPLVKYDLLLEAASENLEIKKKIFHFFEKISDLDTMIASNTSSLSLTLMASQISAPKQSNVLGLHFFNPPKLMKLLEIIITESTSPGILQTARDLGTKIDKEVVVCKDSPGFITSRLGIVFLNEAIFTLQEGLASAEDIDKAIKLGYNHPMGPLTLADYIGLDVVYAVMETLYENYKDSKYRPCLLLKKKIEAGHLGRKTGKGFFSYS